MDARRRIGIGIGLLIVLPGACSLNLGPSHCPGPDPSCSDDMNPPPADLSNQPDMATPVLPSLGTPTTLSTIPATGDGYNWYSTMNHAVFTTRAGMSWVASVEHRAGDTHVDRVAIHSRAGQAAWSSIAPFSFDWSSVMTAGGPWAGGMPAGTTAAADGAGEPHVYVNNRHGSSSISPDRGVYLRQSGGSWQVTEDVVSDEALQTAEGNSSGTTTSGFSPNLVNDPSVNRLYLLGTDGAWFATKYHAVVSSALAGSASWAALSSAYTSTGAVDRGSVIAASQDLRGGVGLQVFVDSPSCTLKGREFSGGSWGGITISVPLNYSACSTDASTSYGISNASTETVLSATGAPTIFFAARPAGMTSPITLIILTKTGTSWTTTTRVVPTWGVNGDAYFRAFDDAAGALHILHLDTSAKHLFLYDVATGSDIMLLTAMGKIGWVDAERHSPKLAVWPDADGSMVRLLTADLSY